MATYHEQWKRFCKQDQIQSIPLRGIKMVGSNHFLVSYDITWMKKDRSKTFKREKDDQDFEWSFSWKSLLFQSAQTGKYSSKG